MIQLGIKTINKSSRGGRKEKQMTKKELKNTQATVSDIINLITEAIKNCEDNNLENVEWAIQERLIDEGYEDICRVEIEDGKLVFSIVMDSDITQMGSYNGKRCYWKKLVIGELGTFKSLDYEDELEDDEELDEDEELEDDEELDEDGGRVIICRDKTRYTPYVRNDRVSMDCADNVAMDLRNMDTVEEVIDFVTGLLDGYSVKLPRKSPANNWVEHAKIKWGHLNNGQKRMLAGQTLRSALNNEDPEDGLLDAYFELIQEARVRAEERAFEIAREEAEKKAIKLKEKEAEQAKKNATKKNAKSPEADGTQAKRPLPKKVANKSRK